MKTVFILSFLDYLPIDAGTAAILRLPPLLGSQTDKTGKQAAPNY